MSDTAALNRQHASPTPPHATATHSMNDGLLLNIFMSKPDSVYRKANVKRTTMNITKIANTMLPNATPTVAMRDGCKRRLITPKTIAANAEFIMLGQNQPAMCKMKSGHCMPLLR